MRRVFFVLFMLAALLACDNQDRARLSASDLWLRAMPPGQSMTAAYGTIENPGPDMVRITGFSSPAFKQVELHETRLQDGVASMHRIKSLEVPARASVILEPGGKHLMMIGARQLPDESTVDGTIEIIVELEQAEPVRLLAVQGR